MIRKLGLALVLAIPFLGAACYAGPYYPRHYGYGYGRRVYVAPPAVYVPPPRIRVW